MLAPAVGDGSAPCILLRCFTSELCHMPVRRMRRPLHGRRQFVRGPYKTLSPELLQMVYSRLDEDPEVSNFDLQEAFKLKPRTVKRLRHEFKQADDAF